MTWHRGVKTLRTRPDVVIAPGSISSMFETKAAVRSRILRRTLWNSPVQFGRLRKTLGARCMDARQLLEGKWLVGPSRWLARLLKQCSLCTEYRSSLRAGVAAAFHHDFEGVGGMPALMREV